jgi:hypothetical protein
MKKATKAWAKTQYTLLHSKFFSIQLWKLQILSRIRPHLEYLGGVWAHLKWKEGDTILNNYLRRALGLQKKSSSTGIQSEIRTIPPSTRRKRQQLKLWGKIINTPKTKFIRKMYENERANLTKSKWTKHVKQTLQEYGLANHWDRQSTTRRTQQTKNGRKSKWNTRITKRIM